LKFAECMRANGVPDFPDPTGTSINIANLEPEQPYLPARRQGVRKQDRREVAGIGGTPRPGTIELDGTLPGRGAAELSASSVVAIAGLLSAGGSSLGGLASPTSALVVGGPEADDKET